MLWRHTHERLLSWLAVDTFVSLLKRLHIVTISIVSCTNTQLLRHSRVDDFHEQHRCDTREALYHVSKQAEDGHPVGCATGHVVTHFRNCDHHAMLTGAKTRRCQRSSALLIFARCWAGEVCGLGNCLIHDGCINAPGWSTK